MPECRPEHQTAESQASAADWRMRPAEACTVTQLEFVISSDGDDNTIAKVRPLNVARKARQLSGRVRLHVGDIACFSPLGACQTGLSAAVPGDAPTD